MISSQIMGSRGEKEYVQDLAGAHITFSNLRGTKKEKKKLMHQNLEETLVLELTHWSIKWRYHEVYFPLNVCLCVSHAQDWVFPLN
jgi:hypothetical protein